MGKWEGTADREKHFEGVFAEFKVLREYIANYSYSIPAYNL